MTIVNNANVYLPPVIQIPSALEITAISQSNPAIITTSANTDQVDTYIPGQAVKISIPATYGMWQMNGLTPVILAINGNQLTVNVSSLYFDAFSVPSDGTGPASLAPSGSRNLQYSNITRQVPFQSYSNQGN